MSRSTGPILATGLVTMANESVLNGRPIDWRVPVATGLLALGVDLIERAWPQGAVVLAWGGLLAVLLTRTQTDIPSPAESLLSWWGKGKGTTT